MTFAGDIDSIPITVSCTNFSASGKVTKLRTRCRFRLHLLSVVAPIARVEPTRSPRLARGDHHRGNDNDSGCSPGWSHLQVEHPFRLRHHRVSEWGRHGSGRLQRLEHRQGARSLSAHQWLWVHQHRCQDIGHGEIATRVPAHLPGNPARIRAVPAEQMGSRRVNSQWVGGVNSTATCRGSRRCRSGPSNGWQRRSTFVLRPRGGGGDLGGGGSLGGQHLRGRRPEPPSKERRCGALRPRPGHQFSTSGQGAGIDPSERLPRRPAPGGECHCGSPGRRHSGHAGL